MSELINKTFYRQVLAVPDHRGKCGCKPTFKASALFGYIANKINNLAIINKINFIQFVAEFLCFECWKSAASTLFIAKNTIIYIYINLTDAIDIFTVSERLNNKKSLISYELTRP